MADQTPLDRFKSVLTGTARAIAREPEVELAYTADPPTQIGKNLKVPMPGRALPPEQVAEARGFADGFALRLRHHNSIAHNRAAPTQPVARAVFDAVETVRIEALGARGMAGMADNLRHALEMRTRSDPIARAKAKDEVPLSSAVALILREKLTGAPSPSSALAGLSLVREWIETAAGADLEALGFVLDDQAAFATLANKLLVDLALTDGDATPDDSDDDGDDEGDDAGANDAPDSDDDSEGEGQVEQRGEQDAGDGEAEGESQGEDQSDDDLSDGGEG